MNEIERIKQEIERIVKEANTMGIKVSITYEPLRGSGPVPIAQRNTVPVVKVWSSIGGPKWPNAEYKR